MINTHIFHTNFFEPEDVRFITQSNYSPRKISFYTWHYKPDEDASGFQVAIWKITPKTSKP